MIRKSTNTTINIAYRIAPIISSRDVVDNLENDISKLKTEMVCLDFAEVDFISRSAAHEFLSLKEKLKRRLLKKKEVVFINTNDDVKKMLRIVAANGAVPERSKPMFEAKAVSISSLMKSFK
ncbi:MAG: STAS domain-containing protein [Patescibacteria group bacterium]